MIKPWKSLVNETKKYENNGFTRKSVTSNKNE